MSPFRAEGTDPLVLEEDRVEDIINARWQHASVYAGARRHGPLCYAGWTPTQPNHSNQIGCVADALT